MATDAPKYFVSYAREDAPFALTLTRQLRESNANIWLDQLDIVGGQRWDEAVEEALRTCEGMLIVLSPASVGSDNVKDEVSYALEYRKLVVPVLYRQCEIPFRLRRLQYVDFTVDDDRKVEGVVKALERRSSSARAIEDPESTKEPVPRRSPSSAIMDRRLPRGRAAVWLVGVVVLGLWPIAATIDHPSDDPFLVNPLAIAGGLLLISFVRPIDPKIALAFSVVPFVLNLWAMALTLPRAQLTYYWSSSEFVLGLVVFVATLFVVRVICAWRAPAR